MSRIEAVSWQETAGTGSGSTDWPFIPMSRLSRQTPHEVVSRRFDVKQYDVTTHAARIGCNAKVVEASSKLGWLKEDG